MSSFTNYDNLFGDYNDLRKPAAADVIAGLLHIRKNLKMLKRADVGVVRCFKVEDQIEDTHLLDVGCGTGNYAVALLQYGIGSISLIDGSENMMERARQNLTKANLMSAVKEIKHSILPSLPFEDNSFDAVMINQVLHHLEKKADGVNFPTVSQTIKEVYRVLKPGGILIITTTTVRQLNAIWYAHLIPEALRRYESILPSLQILQQMFVDNELKTLSTLACLGNYQYTNYEYPEGPLHQTWRNMDSFWSLATESELKKGIKWTEEMKENNTLETFYKEHDRSMSNGIFTILEAKLEKYNNEYHGLVIILICLFC